jgi:hypothetical protein
MVLWCQFGTDWIIHVATTQLGSKAGELETTFEFTERGEPNTARWNFSADFWP